MTADQKFGRLNETAAILPPRTQGVGNCASDAIANGKRNFVRYFACLVDRIDATCDDTDIEVSEFLLVFFEASQLPAAVWSPMAAVEQNDAVASLKLLGNCEVASIYSG